MIFAGCRSHALSALRPPLLFVVLFAGLSVAASRPAAASAEDAQGLIDRMLSALGEREAIAEVRSLVAEAACDGPGGAFRTRVESLRPGSVYFRQEAPDGVTEIWSHEGRTWTREAEGGVRDLPAGVGDFVRAHEFHLVVFEVESRFSSHELGERTTVDGIACRQLRMLDSAGQPAALCVAETDGLPLLLETHPEGAAGPIRTRYADWRAIDGVRYFGSFVLREGDERTFTYRYEVLEPGAVPLDRFALPAPDAGGP